jgi:hypothetical protein
MVAVTIPDDRWRETEALAAGRHQARARRQPLILIAVINVLVIGIALTAMVDLRRLQTPGGTALRWVQAAVFGNCSDYLDFSVADRSPTDTRSKEALCRDLRASTATARGESLKIGIARGRLLRGPGGARVEIVLTRKGIKTPVTLRMVRRDGHWRVLRDALTCGSVGCA